MKTFSNGTVRAEAAAWIAQLETGDLEAADLETLREWIGRSPVHASELRRCAQLSGELNVLSEMKEALEDAAKAYRPMRRKRNRRKWAYPALALGATLLTVLVWRMGAPEVFTETFSTAVGEYREYEMPDGSEIALNTNSRLEVVYTPELRQILLLSGEALFQVAPNADRPFVVQAGLHHVEAVGTAFVVKMVDDQMEVSVTEGQVKLSSPSPALHRTVEPVPLETTSVGTPAALAAVYLQMGQSVKLPVHGQRAEVAEIESVSTAELRRRLAWREGLLDFNRTPLSQVVAEISRYSGVLIIIEDPVLKERHFDGLFRAGETQKLLQALDLLDDIDVTHVDPSTVRISAAQRKQN